MSIKQVEIALESFATKDTARAIVLKGDWGTGKTFLWNRVVLKKKEKFIKPKYCYVSLFGLGNLKDLKRAIFENTVSRETADKPNDMRGLIDRVSTIGDRLDRIYRKGLNVAADISSPLTKGLATTVESIQFASIRNTLICVDDFERKSSGLSDKEVLGLISHLVEIKECSVVLILNSNTISADSDYFKYHEKIFDYEIEFSPPPEDSAGLIFKDEDPFDSIVKSNLMVLKTANVRLFKKVKFYLEVVRPYIYEQTDEIVKQVLSTLPLVVWSIYDSNRNKIDISYIKNFSGGFRLPLGTIREATDEDMREDEAHKALQLYGFNNCDDLDLALISFIEKGYINEELIRQLIADIAAQVAHNKAVATVHKAWSNYSGSFDLDDNEVFESFEKALDVCLYKLTPNDLGSIYELYQSIGKEEIARRHIDNLFNNFREKSKQIDEDRSYRWPRHEYLLEQLNKYLDEQKKPYSAEEQLLHSAINNSYDKSCYIRFSEQGSEWFYTMFKTFRYGDLNSVLKYCMSYGEITSSGDPESQSAFEKIFCSAYEALLRIRQESAMNASRTERFMKFQNRYDGLMEVNK